MKTTSLAAVLVLLSCTFCLSQQTPRENGELHHVVLLKFKAGAQPAQIDQVVEAFKSLKTKVPGVQSLHWGTNVSPEKRNKGFTHCFILTFKSDKDRDNYLTAPAHEEFGKVLGPVLDDVLVIDFWAEQ